MVILVWIISYHYSIYIVSHHCNIYPYFIIFYQVSQNQLSCCQSCIYIVIIPEWSVFLDTYIIYIGYFTLNMDIIVLETTDQQLWCVFLLMGPHVCVYVCVWDQFQHTAGNVLEIRLFMQYLIESVRNSPKNFSLFFLNKFILCYPKKIYTQRYYILFYFFNFIICYIMKLFLYNAAKVQEHLSLQIHNKVFYFILFFPISYNV